MPECWKGGREGGERDREKAVVRRFRQRQSETGKRTELIKAG